MTKWVIAIAGLILLMGTLVWQLANSGPRKIVIQSFDAGPSVVKPASDAAPYKPRVLKSDASTEVEEVVKYDPQSEEFSHQVDVRIPDGFRASLARCDRKGMDPDAKITIRYRLHIEDGVVSASGVGVEKSNLGDTALEQCMVNAIQQARWVAADMPDFMEDTHLFIRIRSLNKYLSKEEQEAAKAEDRIEE
jgi:hypothetical protein